ncbi:autoinducer binding domain-containing protein [Limimaricola litoreus]|uniref:Autoinducer binding domain-containing protein n=1 Tax=Limimaricola litoreus TaxID=2955316 RepID=A0A9X2JPR7_9RHOB|nr:autoinducer binding domain-containing protein [Limimaricola litoreus]MCP1170307.1 autoinducer binding domain-containing protein [Limimaricola litoreus]
MFNCYPTGWVTSYAKQGLLMSDPTVRWAMSNEGALLWGDVDPGDDPRGVMPQAAEYGLRYGVTLSMVSGARSFGGLAHPDRPFDEAEIGAMRTELARLHALTHDSVELDPATRARLAELSIVVTP